MERYTARGSRTVSAPKALPPGKGAQQDRGTAQSIPTVHPWLVYDRFVNGETVDELMVSLQRPEGDVLADIEQMRLILIEQHPGITDDEADRIRFENILIKKAQMDGTPPALKVASEASVRRRNIIDAAKRRCEEEQKKHEALA